MKKLYFAAVLLIFSVVAYSQAVGIGTTTPNASAMLDVTSTTKGFLMPRMTSADRIAIATPAAGLTIYETTTSSVWVYNGSAWTQMASGGASPWTNSGSNIYNSNVGNVGIGTNSPSSKFHLIGNFLQDNGTMTLNNSGSIIQFQNAGVNKVFMQLSGDNLRMGTNSGNSAGKLVFRMDGSDRITIDSTGNMQIIGAQDASLSTHGYLTLGSTIGTNLILDNNEIMARNNGAAANLILQNDGGDIGIGKASPAERLDVDGHARLSGDAGLLKLETSVSGPSGQFTVFKYAPGVHFIRSAGTVLGKMEYVDTLNFSNFLRLQTGSTPSNDLTIGTNHNVGLGTNDAVAKLQINSSGSEQLRIFAPTGGFVQFTSGISTSQVKKAFMDVSGNDFRIGTNTENDAGKFIMRVNGQNIMYGNPDGSLSIGTTSIATGFKVNIGGKIMCEELKVQLRPWADYVFEKEYPLMSLGNVEEFINANKHLPNIPTAKEVEENGLSVGDMQRRMMEKIEELTLYVIDLQKQVTDLKNKK